MNYIGVRQDLVKVVYDRVLNPVFEFSYERKTGSNPVALALKWSKEERNSINLILGGFGWIIVALAGWKIGIEGYRPLDSATTLLLTILFLAPGVLFFLSGSIRSIREDRYKTSIKQFLTDLDVLYGVAEEASVSRQAVLRLETEVLRRLVESALTKKAGEILELQNENDIHPRLDDVRLEFGKMYDTFDRLGLVSGGYKKFFDQTKDR